MERTPGEIPSVLECVSAGLNEECISSIVFAALVGVTFLAVVASAIRIIRIRKKMFNYQLSVLYCLIFLCGFAITYFGFFARRWLFVTIEYFKLISIASVCYFFSFSALRLYGATAGQKRAAKIGFGISILIGSVTFGVAVWNDTVLEKPCTSIPFFLFTFEQLLLILILSVSSVVILSLLQERATLSHSFLKKHVGPVKAMVIINVVAQAITVVFRVYVYVEATVGHTTCSEIFIFCAVFFSEIFDGLLLLKHHNASWYIWMMMVYRVIDVIIPQWAILGYFYKTVQQSNYKSYKNRPNNGSMGSIPRIDSESEAEWWNSLDRTGDDDNENELHFGFGRPPALLNSNIYTDDEDQETGLAVSYTNTTSTKNVTNRPSLAFKPHQVTTDES